MLKTKHTISLFAFCTYPILFLYSNNFASVSIIQIITPLLISYSLLAAFLLFLWIAQFWYRINSEKAFIILLLLSSIFLYYGHIHLGLYNSDLAYFKYGELTVNLGRNRYLLIAIVLILFGLIWAILNAKKLTKLTQLLVTLSFILILQQVGIFIYKASNSVFKNSSNISHSSKSKLSNRYPDVYYIILDAYAANSTLERSFSFDNSSFTDSLSTTGFKVVKNSTSNYPFTKFSLTSSLNFEYLDSKKYKYDENLFYYLKHNRISEKFKSKGYTYIYFDTGYGYKAPVENEMVIKDDILSDNSSDNDFFGLFIKTTLFSIYINEFSQIKHDEFRRRINFAFNSLPRIAQLKNSKFVFLHIICPHPPYIFKENGSPQRYVPESSGFAKSAYLQQLKYINSKTLEAVNDILKNSVKPPIIIIQSDHGASFDNKFALGSKVALKDQFFILNTIYGPESITKKFYPGISPVNTFRIITNELFREKIPLLEDKSFFTGQTPPYNYINITGHLDKGAGK